MAFAARLCSSQISPAGSRCGEKERHGEGEANHSSSSSSSSSLPNAQLKSSRFIAMPVLPCSECHEDTSSNVAMTFMDRYLHAASASYDHSSLCIILRFRYASVHGQRGISSRCLNNGITMMRSSIFLFDENDLPQGYSRSIVDAALTLLRVDLTLHYETDAQKIHSRIKGLLSFFTGSQSSSASCFQELTEMRPRKISSAGIPLPLMSTGAAVDNPAKRKLLFHRHPHRPAPVRITR